MINPGEKPWWQKVIDFVGTRSNWFAPGSVMDQIVPKLPGPAPNNPYNAVGEAGKSILPGLNIWKGLTQPTPQSRAPRGRRGLAAPVRPANISASARVSSRVTRPPKTAPVVRSKRPKNTRGY